MNPRKLEGIQYRRDAKDRTGYTFPLTVSNTVRLDRSNHLILPTQPALTFQIQEQDLESQLCSSSCPQCLGTKPAALPPSPSLSKDKNSYHSLYLPCFTWHISEGKPRLFSCWHLTLKEKSSVHSTARRSSPNSKITSDEHSEYSSLHQHCF